jgi:hypothetical protein
MNDDDRFYEDALGRIYRWLLVLTVAGAAGASLWRGWRWGLGFLVGAAASLVSFRAIHRIALALGPGDKAPRTKLAVLLGLRYLAFGLAGYLAVRAFATPAASILLGLTVSVAAILIEIAYQLVFLRTE